MENDLFQFPRPLKQLMSPQLWQGEGQRWFKAHQPLRPQVGVVGSRLQNPSPPLGSPEGASAQGFSSVGQAFGLKEI